MFSLRPATDFDYGFLYNVAVATMKEYVAAVWGWDEDWQADRFKNDFVAADWQIVAMDNIDIGGLNLQRGPAELFIANIYILTEYQGRGIGTAIICNVILQAKSLGIPATLTVLKVNTRARKFYERLGFRVVEDQDYKYRMSTEGRYLECSILDGQCNAAECSAPRVSRWRDR